MTKIGGNKRKYASWTASALAAATLAFSPILFPAFAAQLSGGNAVSAKSWLDSYTAAGVDRKLAAKFNRISADRNLVAANTKSFLFTPAGINRGAVRTMTIAARADSPLSANAISTRNLARVVESGAGNNVQLSTTDFSLKSARGWQGFKLPSVPRNAVKSPISDIALATGGFRLDDKTPAKKSRFNTDVKLDKAREAAPSLRGNAAAGEYKVGLESSFSLSRRIDLTAGVRYNSERDRVDPTVDERKDSEAVYVGTKIRF
jgi:hypothetical protein